MAIAVSLGVVTGPTKTQWLTMTHIGRFICRWGDTRERQVQVIRLLVNLTGPEVKPGRTVAQRTCHRLAFLSGSLDSIYDVCVLSRFFSEFHARTRRFADSYD
jgi:hypothetical protein